MTIIRYVGIENLPYLGKRLFDILCRLKGFGIGRMVYRFSFNNRYSEPSYYIITKVEPNMKDPQNFVVENSKAWGIKTFRGETRDKPVPIESCHIPDWRLVPKHEEELFYNKKFERSERPLIPSKMHLPPLLEHFVLKDAKHRGLTIDGRPQIKRILRNGVNSRNISDAENEFLNSIK